MLNRRARYGWMTLGGLLCLLGVVVFCKFRDGNVAHAQSEPPRLADVDRNTAEPPLAEPPHPLPPVGAGVLKSVTPLPSSPPTTPVLPVAAESPAPTTTAREPMPPLGRP